LNAESDFIPIAAPDLGGNEESYVVDAIRSSWISSSGKYVRKFEEDFAQICETQCALSINNGTSALHLAIVALGVKPGDEIVLPSLTYVATANAVRYAGGIPVFVDVDPTTWCIDPALIEEVITPQTKGIIAVDLYGHPCDMDPINDIAKRRGLWVLEDAAEAHFARYKGRVTGGLATVAAFSFFGNKIVTCGEGGALTTNDIELDARLRLLRNQGMDPNRRYFFPVIGYNYRLTNLACALLCAQLERREQLTARRRQIFRRYHEHLAGVPGIGLQPVAPWAEVTPWLYCVTLDPEVFGRSRDEIAADLLRSGVETRPFFIPIHQLPPYAEFAPNRPLKETLTLSARGINLPTFTGMADSQIDRVCELLTASTR
jgi:perosamine synthetase